MRHTIPQEIRPHTDAQCGIGPTLAWQGWRLRGLREIFLGRLKLIRKARNLSEDDIAEGLGLKSSSTIRQWYGRRQSDPSLSQIIALAKTLEVDPRDFFIESKEVPPRINKVEEAELARLRREYLLEAVRDEMEPIVIPTDD